MIGFNQQTRKKSFSFDWSTSYAIHVVLKVCEQNIKIHETKSKTRRNFFLKEKKIYETRMAYKKICWT